MTMYAHEYLKKLSMLAHWKFSRSETDEIVADYEELLSDAGATNAEELRREMGSPVQAVRQLGNSTSYRGWLAAFGVMALCMGVLAFYIYLGNREVRLLACLMGVGLAMSTGWFLQAEKGYPRKKPLPRGILLTLLLLLMLLCAGGILIWISIHSVSRGHAMVVLAAVRCIGLLCAVAGTLGLIAAKLYDRRWRSIYTLGITMVMMVVLALTVFQSMDLDMTITSWWMPYVWGGSGILTVGIAATAVSLC